MRLEDIGWDSTFQEEVDHLDLDNIVIGRVYRVNRNDYDVMTELGDRPARLAGRLRSFNGQRELPAVGDWVIMRELGTGLNIFHVLDRRSTISRRSPGKDVSQQIVASNVDILFIVMGLDGDLNPSRLERYLVLASGSGCRPVVLLNKSDLIDEDDPRVGRIEGSSPGVDVHFISAREGKGLEKISSYLGKRVTAVLIGSSGAGKSTIINGLMGEKIQRTEEVRGSDSKGRHITTHRELFFVPSGGMLIDNPGIREVQLWGGTEDVELAFQDINHLSVRCRFNDCSHEVEPGCAVLKAVEDGRLSVSRYRNYLKMKREMDHLEKKMDKGYKAEEKRKWRNIMKDVKHYRRYKEKGE